MKDNKWLGIKALLAKRMTEHVHIRMSAGSFRSDTPRPRTILERGSLRKYAPLVGDQYK